MDQHITPKSLVLSMLQAPNGKAMPVKTLVSIGQIFGFTGNTIRVTTTRLLREGTIESDVRGLYRLSQKGARFSRFIDRWKKGEGRLREWDGCWLCFLMPKNLSKQQVQTGRVSDFLGFREGLPHLWVRPDNLSIEYTEIDALLSQIGRIENGEMFVARQFSEKLTEKWQSYLWPVKKLLQTQKVFLDKITKSTDRIEKMPLENALVESFLVGSEAVQLLIMDPLLPEEMMDSSLRVKLTNAMLAYDEIGKQIWSKRFEEILIYKSPTHLQLMGKAM